MTRGRKTDAGRGSAARGSRADEASAPLFQGVSRGRRGDRRQKTIVCPTERGDSGRCRKTGPRRCLRASLSVSGSVRSLTQVKEISETCPYGDGGIIG